MAESTPPDTGRHTLRLVLSWGLVGIPLAWGIYETLTRAMALFE